MTPASFARPRSLRRIVVVALTSTMLLAAVPAAASADPGRGDVQKTDGQYESSMHQVSGGDGRKNH